MIMNDDMAALIVITSVYHVCMDDNLYNKLLLLVVRYPMKEFQCILAHCAVLPLQ